MNGLQPQPGRVLFMVSAPFPPNESDRLFQLKALEILDTEPESIYDEVTRLASHIGGTPISLVSLVDEDRQWFKSKVGLGASQTPRDVAFCSHAILGKGLFEIPDSRKDSRFSDNPLVTGEPRVIFYAGVPLEIEAGVSVGTLCVIDHQPRQLTKEQVQALECLGNQVIAYLKLRRSHRELQQVMKARSIFFAAMSHEIRTPMNGILGLTKVVLDSVTEETAREKLRLVQSCGNTLLTLINDILDFSKLE